MCRLLTKAKWNAVAFLFSACLFNGIVIAQEVRPVAGTAGVARPAPLDSSVLSPELEQLLRDWEVRSGRIKNIQGVVHRYEYDSIYKTVKSSTGKYWFQDPDKARMDFEPDSAAVPGSKTMRGKDEYSLLPGNHVVWVCDGEQILFIDPARKEYNRVEILPAYRGKKISEGPLPFLFGMEANKLKERYVIQLGSMHNPQERIHIVAYPKMPSEQGEYRSAEVLLDPNTFLPTAIQLLAPTEDQVTVYLFKNHKEFSVTANFVSPFKYNLRGMNLLRDTTDTSRFERDASINDKIRIQ